MVSFRLYIGILLYVGVISIEAAEIHDVQSKIMSIYEKPRGTPEELVDLAKMYLRELQALNASIVEKDPEAIKLAEGLYKELTKEGPKHVGIIPYGKFIDLFNWSGLEISSYHDIIADTRRVWDDVMRGIGVEVSEELGDWSGSNMSFMDLKNNTQT